MPEELVKVASPMVTKVTTSATATATKKAISTTAGDMRVMRINNSANSSVAYVKLWDTAVGSVTVGTTAPDVIWGQPASTDTTYIFISGQVFTAAITSAVVTTPGPSGTSSMASAVDVTFGRVS